MRNLEIIWDGHFCACSTNPSSTRDKRSHLKHKRAPMPKDRQAKISLQYDANSRGLHYHNFWVWLLQKAPAWRRKLSKDASTNDDEEKLVGGRHDTDKPFQFCPDCASCYDTSRIMATIYSQGQCKRSRELWAIEWLYSYTRKISAMPAAKDEYGNSLMGAKWKRLKRNRIRKLTPAYL